MRTGQSENDKREKKKRGSTSTHKINNLINVDIVFYFIEGERGKRNLHIVRGSRTFGITLRKLIFWPVQAKEGYTQ